MSDANAGPLTVVATVVARPGQEEAVKALMLGMIAPTRVEAGCIEYALHADREDPTRFVMMERWESEAALQAHLNAPHFRLFAEKLGAVAQGMPDIRKLSAVE